MTLSGKTAVVTGASSGIGEATASLLAQQNCNVVLAAELGEGALAIPTDVTDPAACEALVSRTVGDFGVVGYPRRQRRALQVHRGWGARRLAQDVRGQDVVSNVQNLMS